MSPSVYTLRPILAFFPDCGLGSDPNATGPCTGTYTPQSLGQSVADYLMSGKGAIFAVGAAFLLLASVVLLIRMLRRAAGDSQVTAEDDQDAVPCADCGAPVAAEALGEDLPFCDVCFVARVEALLPGQAFCAVCGATYWTDGDVEPSDDDWGCPVCGAGARAAICEGEPPDSDAGVCTVCGRESDELIGDLFPACPECAAVSDDAARLSEIDDGPDDEETFDGNPRGIGGGGVRA